MRLLFLAILIFQHTFFPQTNIVKLSGRITNSSTKEPIPNCNILIISSRTGTTSDSSGMYNIFIAHGTYEIKVSHVAYHSRLITIEISDDRKQLRLDIELEQNSLMQKEIDVTGKRILSSLDVQMLPQQEIKHMPSFNNDVLQSVTILPGVSSNNELSNNYNVRGGTFTENLIYLNGYEIYRPFFIKNGIQENQSIANPDLVNDFSFYNGAFQAKLGDKLSSALEINYSGEFDSTVSGNARSSLLFSAVSIKSKYKNLNWAVAARYTYPNLFMSIRQLKGTYNPSYFDGQILANYNLSPNDRLELLLIKASNKFDVTPYDWNGQFQINRADIRNINGNYSGSKLYSFDISLAGLRFNKRFDENTSLFISSSFYYMKENENNNLTGNYYYSPNAYTPEEDKEYLKTSFEYADNYLKMNAFELNILYKKNFASHKIISGISGKIVNLNGLINQSYYETGAEASQTIPDVIYTHQNNQLNSVSAYLQDDIKISEMIRLNAGLRFLRYYYNNENLFSPRIGIFFYPSPIHSFKFMFGYYFQPPFFQELKSTSEQILKSQKAIHYVLGWDYQFETNTKMLVELYYKDLKNIIPFNLNEVKIEYLTNRITSGYAYGFDIQFQGEFVKGAQSWAGYSYLNTKEKVNGEKSGYMRRLLDQTHTLQFFIQDRIPKHPNWKAHTRIIFGSGYLYYPQIIKAEENGNKYLTYAFDYRFEDNPYFRTDMGLSAEFDFDRFGDLLITVEVLNVFNAKNNSGFTWLKPYKNSDRVVPIMQTISRRFFNVGVELIF